MTVLVKVVDRLEVTMEDMLDVLVAVMGVVVGCCCG